MNTSVSLSHLLQRLQSERRRSEETGVENSQHGLVRRPDYEPGKGNTYPEALNLPEAPCFACVAAEFWSILTVRESTDGALIEVGSPFLFFF